MKKVNPEIDHSTEERIKNAARVVFYKKGYAAARTRDIALEAGINLALLNYYFRSKEKLFDIIMMETMMGFIDSLSVVFNDEKTSFDHKVESIVNRYIDLLIKQPEIPLFIMGELRNNPHSFALKINIGEKLMKSCFMKQFLELITKGKIKPVNPVHFIMNLMGMVVFPFIGSPILKTFGNLNQKDFDKLMIERKRLIPKWMKAILKTT